MTQKNAEGRKVTRARNSVFAFLGSPVPHVELMISIVSFLVLLGLWWVATYFEWIPHQFLASPPAVVEALYRLFVQFDFIDDVWIDSNYFRSNSAQRRENPASHWTRGALGSIRLDTRLAECDSFDVITQVACLP